MTRNRNPIKQWFYTFPQTTVTKTEFRDKLDEIHTLKYYKIVQETHENGGKHLHAVVVCKKPISKSKILKKIKEIYPNDNKRIDVQPVRSINDALAYLSKEDTCPLESALKYHDPRDPRNNMYLNMARKWGFPNVKSFKDHMEQYKRNKQLEDDKMLERIAELERKLIKYPKIVLEPEIQYLLHLRDKYLLASSHGMSISKEDRTKFHQLYDFKVELL